MFTLYYKGSPVACFYTKVEAYQYALRTYGALAHCHALAN